MNADCRKLREKKKEELLKELDDFKKELQSLKVAKVTGGAPNKVAKMYYLNLILIKYIIDEKLKNLLQEF